MERRAPRARARARRGARPPRVPVPANASPPSRKPSHSTRPAPHLRERATATEPHACRCDRQAVERVTDGVDVGPVAEELQRHVPLRPRGPARVGQRRARRRARRSRRARRRAGTTATNARSRVTSAQDVQRQSSLPSGSCITIQRQSSVPIGSALARRRAERDEPLGLALDVGADDQVEVHRFFTTLPSGTFWNTSFGPAPSAGTIDRYVAPLDPCGT